MIAATSLRHFGSPCLSILLSASLCMTLCIFLYHYLSLSFSLTLSISFSVCTQHVQIHRIQCAQQTFDSSLNKKLPSIVCEHYLRDSFPNVGCESLFEFVLIQPHYQLLGVRNLRAPKTRSIPPWWRRQCFVTWCVGRRTETSTLSSSQCFCES